MSKTLMVGGFIWLLVNDKAREIFKSGLFEIYHLWGDGSESLIQTEKELQLAIDLDHNIGIEVGEVDEDYLETHYEMVSAITLKVEDEYPDPENFIVKRGEEQGRGGLYELAKELTDEFQEKHNGRLWDSDFFDEIQSFLNEKNKQL